MYNYHTHHISLHAKLLHVIFHFQDGNSEKVILVMAKPNMSHH